MMHVVNLGKALYALHAFIEKLQVRDRPAKAGRRVDRRALTALTGVRYGGLNMAKLSFEKSSRNLALK